LKCRECGQQYPLAANHVCEFCFGPLDVEYDYAEIAACVSRQKIASGPLSIWRYSDLLPVTGTTRVDLQAGFTPLIKAERLGEKLGLSNLYLKNDTVNPTGSFKDRVVSVALSAGIELGIKVASCASTGNLANSVAAHAAKAQMEAFVFIPADLEKVKILATAVYGAHIIAIDGNYDDVNRLCAEITSEEPDWGFANVNLRSFYSEGSKTLGFEIVEQLGWRFPDHVVVPVGSGSQLTKIDKAFRELYQVGLMETEPHVKISGAQPSGCSPVASAFIDGKDFIKPVKPQTVAKSLAIGNPADGPYALDVVRKTGGGFGSVTDDEILEAISLVASTEGIFVETAGGVTVATLARLARERVVDRDETVVAILSGNGLKTVEAIEAAVAKETVIRPSLEEFNDYLNKLER
jgi:threonine synthase